MIKISTLFMLSCTLILNADKIKRPINLFGMTADDMFEMALGDVEAKNTQRDLNFDTQNHDHNKKIFDSSIKPKFISSTLSPNNRGSQITPLPKLKKQSTNIEEVKVRLKKMRVMQLLKDKSNPIPDFQKNGDDPNIQTRRFDEMSKDYSQNQFELKQKDALRQVYLEGDDYASIRSDKSRILELMRQFIYMTRYKMGIMTVMRKKYMNHIKYKIGYLFALLRLVRYQQKMIYSTLKTYYDTWSNPMIHMQFYFKVIKLDVDIKDLVKYLLRLNHDMKLFYDPTYYDDTHEAGPWENYTILNKNKRP